MHLIMTEMDRKQRVSHDFPQRGSEHARHNSPTTTQRQQQRPLKAKLSDHDRLGDHSESSYHSSTMPPSKQDEVELLAVPLRDTSHYHEDVEKGQSSSFFSSNTKNFFTSAASLKAIWSCLLYSFCSVSMILTNKSLASSYNHLMDGSLNILLVVFQAVAAVILVEGCRYGKLVDYPPLSINILKAWAPVNVFFCLMLFTGMAALQTNSVPMVTVFKNVANICTATGDYLFYGNRPENLAIMAFGVMLAGAVFAASNDVSITFKGVFWMVANCLSTSGYVLYMKHATQTVKMNKFGMVFVNNVLCVLFLLPVATFTGEVAIFMRSQNIHTLDYFVKNTFAGFVGFFLNFASLNCVAAAGPTTYAIVGSLNKVPVAFLGFFFFRTPMTYETAFFIAVSLCGGVLYSYAKILSSQQRAATNQEAK